MNIVESKINEYEQKIKSHLEENRLQILFLSEKAQGILESKIVFAEMWADEYTLYLRKSNSTIYKVIYRYSYQLDTFSIMSGNIMLIEFTPGENGICSSGSSIPALDALTFKTLFEKHLDFYRKMVASIRDLQEEYYKQQLSLKLENRVITKVFFKNEQPYLLLDDKDELFIGGFLLDLKESHRTETLKLTL